MPTEYGYFDFEKGIMPPLPCVTYDKVIIYIYIVKRKFHLLLTTYIITVKIFSSHFGDLSQFRRNLRELSEENLHQLIIFLSRSRITFL